jgi:hypothetical protein
MFVLNQTCFDALEVNNMSYRDQTDTEMSSELGIALDFILDSDSDMNMSMDMDMDMDTFEESFYAHIVDDSFPIAASFVDENICTAPFDDISIIDHNLDQYLVECYSDMELLEDFLVFE